MTRGLSNNPSGLIITRRPQWRKPDPKHGTARHEQPTVPLINERQLPWCSLFVSVKKGEHRDFKVLTTKILGKERVGCVGRLGSNLKIILTPSEAFVLKHNSKTWRSDIFVLSSQLMDVTFFQKDKLLKWNQASDFKFPLVFFVLLVCVCDWEDPVQRWQSYVEREERKSSSEKMTEAASQRPWLFSEMNINNTTHHNGSPEIREITSIVPPSPTDTHRSAEGRIRRIEEHNLAAHHAPLFKIHNGLWSSATPFKPCDVQRCRGKGHVSAPSQHWLMVGFHLFSSLHRQNTRSSHCSTLTGQPVCFFFFYSSVLFGSWVHACPSSTTLK